MKRYGDKWSPGLIPLEGLNFLWGIPLMRMEYESIFTHLMIKSIHFVAKPNLFMTTSKKFHFTLSYAFFISNFKAI